MDYGNLKAMFKGFLMRVEENIIYALLLLNENQKVYKVKFPSNTMSQIIIHYLMKTIIC